MAGRDEQKAKTWRQRIAGWRRSKLSIRDFCDLEQISVASFYAWRRKLEPRRQGPLGHSGMAGMSGQPCFVPVQIVPDSGVLAASDRRLEIHLPSGVRLSVPSGFDGQTLSAVLTALHEEATSC